jgi:hypothetical protein
MLMLIMQLIYQSSEWAGLSLKKAAHGLSNLDQAQPAHALSNLGPARPWATHLVKNFFFFIGQSYLLLFIEE